MKIAFINEYFLPFTPGGAEWSIYYLAKELVKNGHQVRVITPNYGAKPFEMIDGIKVFRFPFPLKLRKGQVSAPYYAHNNLLFYLYSGWWLWRYLRKENADIINAQNRYSLIGSFLAGKILRVPVFFTIRDNNSFCPTGMCTHHFDEKNPAQRCGLVKFWQNCSEEYIRLYIKPKNMLIKMVRKLILLYFWLDTQMHQWFMNKADGIIAVSQGILDIYLKAGIVKQIKTKVIYNLPPDKVNVDTVVIDKMKEKYGLKGKKVVLYVGKFSIGKGTPLFFKVAKKIVSERNEIVFLLVGKGDLKIFDEGIKVLSSLPHREILKLYQLADVVVAPSRMPDALNRTILESMTVGKPVIGTNRGGMSELIDDGKNGFIVKYGNGKDLERKLLQLLLDNKLRKVMGKKSGQIIKEKFNSTIITKQLVGFYHEVIRQTDDSSQ